MKKGRKEGFLHPAISSKITLAKEKDRKNTKIEEKEIVVVVFFFGREISNGYTLT